MSQFKVGQRVRIVKPGNYFGKEATILRFSPDPRWSPESLAKGISGSAYNVSVDGQGERGRTGQRLAFRPHWLVPLLPPDVKLFMERIMQPIGCLDAPPRVERVRVAS